MDTKTKRTLTPARAHKFIESLDPEPDRECAYLLAITMGLRRGEICGLSWGNIGFDRKVADIRHSYDYMGNLKATKTEAGTRVLPTSLSRWWTEDRPKYGLNDWHLHEFRHTCLTLLAINGVHPKVMRELAGHYSSQISMDIYTHVNMDSKRKAVAAVASVF